MAFASLLAVCAEAMSVHPVEAMACTLSKRQGVTCRKQGGTPRVQMAGGRANAGARSFRKARKLPS